MTGSPSPTMIAMSLLLGGLGVMGVTGCEDAHQGLVLSEDPGDMNTVNPDDPELEPGAGTDMGAEWSVDAAPVDAAAPDPRGPDSGGDELDGDAALPETPPPQPDMAPPPDMGEYRWPDMRLDDDLGMGGESVNDFEEPPEQGDVDPSELPVPQCGTYGPAQALWDGPAAAATFLHGGPGVLFDEPALAGCQPQRLRNESDERLWQEMFFDYGWDRVVNWLWWLHTLDGWGYPLAGHAIYGGDGRIIWASYACVGSVEPEVYSFHYRGDQLLDVGLARPADCQPMAAGGSVSLRYVYGEHPRWPEVRIEIAADGSERSIELDYVREAEGERRLVAIQEYDPRGPLLLERRFTYDAAGRVIQEVRTPANGRSTRTRYAYDDADRLVERVRGDDILQIDYDAAGDIERVQATNPAFVVRDLRFPERSLLEPAGMDLEPHPDLVDWR